MQFYTKLYFNLPPQKKNKKNKKNKNINKYAILLVWSRIRQKCFTSIVFFFFFF